MAQNLFAKHRPKNLDTVFGHNTVIKELKKRFKENSIPHAILLSGFTGTGKTTLIRIIAKSILCQNKDENGYGCGICDICTIIDNEKLSYNYFELNASNLGIDEMRDIEESTSKRVLGQYNIKIFVIDEMQELSKSKAAEKNLLKVLEKPNDNVYFILGTMDAYKVNTAIKNRCVHYKLNPLSFQDITKCLDFICKQEGILVDTKEKAETLITIAQNSLGSVRTAISYLERVIYSDIWNAQELLKELDIIADDEIINIINYIFAGDMRAFKFEMNEEVFKRVRYLTLLYYKLINGVELEHWQKNTLRNIVCENKYAVEGLLEHLNELAKYPYIYTDLIEFYFLKFTKQAMCALSFKSAKDPEENKIRREKKNA